MKGKRKKRKEGKIEEKETEGTITEAQGTKKTKQENTEHMPGRQEESQLTTQQTEALTSESLDPGPLEQPGGGVPAIVVEVLDDLLLLQRIPADPHANVCRHLLGSDPAEERIRQQLLQDIQAEKI